MAPPGAAGDAGEARSLPWPDVATEQGDPPVTRLSDAEIRAGLADLDGWAVDGPQITREYSFPSFPDAIAFVVRLSYPAEAADHHPDLDIRYDRVRVMLSTHSEGGVTAKDLDLARTAHSIAAGRRPGPGPGGG